MENNSVLTYSAFDSESYCYKCCGDGGIVGYLARTKLPEDIITTSSASSTQYIEPSAKNRYIRTVTILPLTTTALTVTPSTSVQTFTSGPYGTVTVNATTTSS